jgi:diadenylate cyclase
VIDFINNLVFIFQRLDWLDIVDLMLVTVIFYVILLLVRDTQAVILLQGVLLLIVLISLMASSLNLPAFTWLLRTALPALVLAIPVIFAPEIRRALERLGRASHLTFFSNGRTSRQKRVARDVVATIVHACRRLSDRRHGALIVLQRVDTLQEFIETGVSLDAEISAELLLQIFYPNTPLHDGAAIVRGDRVVAAACVMPLSASGVLVQSAARGMGLRHRAALGASEISDAVTVVVSEESGAISVAYGGRMIQRLDEDRLDGVLRAFFQPVGKTNAFERWLVRVFPGLVSRGKVD